MAVDLRGRGLSDKPAHGYSMEDHAADIIDMLDRLGIESTVRCSIRPDNQIQNERLYNIRIPINSWRTNKHGHLHLWRIKKKPPRPRRPSRPPASGPSASAMSNSDDAPVLSPELHSGEGGVISSIDWETITAEDLLTGKYSEDLLTEAATGPTGTGRNAERWGMEELTEKQVALGLSILLFITDPQNNEDIDISTDRLFEQLRMARYLRRNPRKNDRIARMAELGLKQLEYIIGQHSQDYHPSGDAPESEPAADTVALAASGTDALTADSTPAPATPPDRNTYLPIQAHWWMHEFRAR